MIPITELLGEDHESLADLLDELQAKLQQHDAANSFDLLDIFWGRLAVHIRAENLCLFPRLLEASRELPGKTGSAPSHEKVAATLENLQADHNFFMKVLSDAVKTMRGLRKVDMPEVASQIEAIRESIVALSARMQSHNVTEEHAVYIWPCLILSAAELEQLGSELRQELDNLPPRFAGLSHER